VAGGSGIVLEQRRRGALCHDGRRRTGVAVLPAHRDGVEVFSRELGVGMQELTREFAQARNAISFTERHDLRRGFVLTFVAVASVVWLAGLLVLIYLAHGV
jgi:hypothetical protein